MGVHIGVTWQIRLNDPCAAAMRSCVKMFCQLVLVIGPIDTVRDCNVLPGSVIGPMCVCWCATHSILDLDRLFRY